MKKEWNLGYKEANVSHDYASRVYATLIFAQSQYLFTYVNDNDEPIGFVGFSNKHLKTTPHFKNFTDQEMLKFNYLISSEAVGNTALENYYKAEEHVETVQHDHYDNYLEILILDKDYRNANAAQKMVKLIQNIMKQLQNINPHYNFDTLSIYTTNKCSYKFYDKIGCELAYTYNLPGETQMIYTLNTPVRM